jgi:nicotinate-nucleotide--dimethylbenzimidazole phosphoribosyltransferase
VGVATPLAPDCDGAPGFLRLPLGPGTANLAEEPAMDLASCRAALGGYEIAALAGFIVGGAAAGVPVLVDGLVANAALLAAERLVPGVASHCIAGHRSVEPGASVVLEELGMVPVLDLDLRLGEGSGACLALPVVEAAARLLAEMATFDSAGVTDKDT